VLIRILLCTMILMNYILYKNPIQLDTLAIVQYLHSLGCNAQPRLCIERGHPAWVTELPSIETSGGQRYIGFDQCIQFYESLSGRSDLLADALAFKDKHRYFRIHI
jgi:hypothetical protein